MRLAHAFTTFLTRANLGLRTTGTANDATASIHHHVLDGRAARGPVPFTFRGGVRIINARRLADGSRGYGGISFLGPLVISRRELRKLVSEVVTDW
jgi:hypothetical protein